MMGKVEDLIGLCTVISDYCLLLQLKSWDMRGAYNHSAPWVLAGQLVTCFIVLTTLWMKEMMWGRSGRSYSSIVWCESGSWLRLKTGA